MTTTLLNRRTSLSQLPNDVGNVVITAAMLASLVHQYTGADSLSNVVSYNANFYRVPPLRAGPAWLQNKMYLSQANNAGISNRGQSAEPVEFGLRPTSAYMTQGTIPANDIPPDQEIEAPPTVDSTSTTNNTSASDTQGDHESYG